MCEVTCKECPCSFWNTADKLSAKLMACLYGDALWHMMATSTNNARAWRFLSSDADESKSWNHRQVFGCSPCLDANSSKQANL